MTRPIVVGLATTVLSLTACEGVPSLTFATGDADVDANMTDSPSAAPDALPAGCPGPNPPAGASVCCGSVPCDGDCAGRCPECEATCTSPDTFCCAKTNNILCRSAGSTCN
jgi:hypothetical protein